MWYVAKSKILCIYETVTFLKYDGCTINTQEEFLTGVKWASKGTFSPHCSEVKSQTAGL